MTMDAQPHVLVADDEPVSLEYLLAALREIGCRADGATSGNQVLTACATTAYDLLLLDRRMPDLGGAALLRELHRRGCNVVAIATSAELDAPMRTELAQAGYVDAVTKPIGVERLTALLATHLPHCKHPHAGFDDPSCETTSLPTSSSTLIEDDAALAGVGGDMQTLLTLRGLFARELETTVPRIAAMSPNELGDWLHRLRASCRYCGATRLGKASELLESRVKSPATRYADELTVFSELCRQTLEVLLERGRATECRSSSNLSRYRT
jgi:two-component system OmpR family response regulator